MEAILSNAQSIISADDFIRSCAAAGITHVELRADKEMLLALEGIQSSQAIDCFRKHLAEYDVQLYGFYLLIDFNLFEDIVLAKKCINLLKLFEGGVLRLELSGATAMETQSSLVNRVTAFLTAVGRFASFSAGSGMDETIVRIAFDLFSQTELTAENLLTINHNLLPYTNVGICMNGRCNNNRYESFLPDVNGHDLSINAVSFPFSQPLHQITQILSRMVNYYDGPAIVEINSPADITELTNLLKVIAPYRFQPDRIDYTKVSYPGSIARYLTTEGQARIEPSGDIVAGTIGCWKYTYSVGAMGIANNGGIKLSFHHSTNWQRFQLERPDLSGYVSVDTTGMAKISVSVLNQEAVEYLNIKVIEGNLIKDDEIHIIIGDLSCGCPGSRAQTFQQTSFCFFTMLDVSGHGFYFDYKNPPVVRITGGEAAKIKVLAPSVVNAGDLFNIGVRVEDCFHNNASGYCDSIKLTVNGEELQYLKMTSHPVYSSVMKFSGICLNSVGVHTIVATSQSGIIGRSNAIRCTPDQDEYRVFWGDIHCHLGYMDSVGKVDEFYDYARNISFLDFTCHSEHMDSYSGGRQASNPLQWEIIRNGAADFNKPGDFVTLLGYENSEEWDANLYFEEDETAWHVDSFAPRLFEFAKTHNALVIPHMTSYPQRQRGYNWDNYDPKVMPVAEIYSCHGSSEFFGGELPLCNCEPGGFVVDALNKGCRLGFIGSSDGHDCMPGNAPWGPYMNGLIAVYAKNLTRQEIYQAIKDRRCYATTNCRILGYFNVNGSCSGSEISIESGGVLQVHVEFYGSDAIDAVDIVKDGHIIHSVSSLETQLIFDCPVEAGLPGSHYIYVRMKQEDGEMAWLSPVFCDVIG